MIESIEFKNFKALRDTVLPLSRFTLIIGPNGSGKSTAIQALKIANQLRSFSFYNVVTAGLTGLANEKVKLTIKWDGDSVGAQTVIAWQGMRGGECNHHHSDPAGLNRKLSATRIYSLDAKAIATSTRLQPNIELAENGANLAGVLDRLRDQHPESFEALNQEVGRLLPEYDRILFDTPSEGTRSFLLRTREGHHRISTKDISEGTLLAIALLTLAYLPDPPPIVCIEEPDRGIHPRLLRDVKDALMRLCYPESVGENRPPVQVIATTHSPYFLDLFKDHPEDVVVANKIGQEVKFERLSDYPHYDEIMQDASLGDAWYTGIFGGVPAHP